MLRIFRSAFVKIKVMDVEWGGGGYFLSPGLHTENAVLYGGFECPFIFSSLSLSEPGVPGRADKGSLTTPPHPVINLLHPTLFC